MNFVSSTQLVVYWDNTVETRLPTFGFLFIPSSTLIPTPKPFLTRVQIWCYSFPTLWPHWNLWRITFVRWRFVRWWCVKWLFCDVTICEVTFLWGDVLWGDNLWGDVFVRWRFVRWRFVRWRFCEVTICEVTFLWSDIFVFVTFTYRWGFARWRFVRAIPRIKNLSDTVQHF